jgi:hypothetical protein
LLIFIEKILHSIKDSEASINVVTFAVILDVKSKWRLHTVDLAVSEKDAKGLNRWNWYFEPILGFYHAYK